MKPITTTAELEAFCAKLADAPFILAFSQGAACPKCVGTDDDGHGLAVAGEGDFFSGEDAVEDLGEGRPGLADRHRRRHIRHCTPMYNNVRWTRGETQGDRRDGPDVGER